MMNKKQNYFTRQAPPGDYQQEINQEVMDVDFSEPAPPGLD